MDLFGIGFVEMVVVLLVALLALGPGRMVEVARTIGKLWIEARRSLRELADMATVNLDAPVSRRPKADDPLPEPEDSVSREPRSTTVDGTGNEDQVRPDEASDAVEPSEEARGRG